MQDISEGAWKICIASVYEIEWQVCSKMGGAGEVRG
jgi:hypothetical protein